jgi:phosphatidate cytidylyltransferase
MKRVLTAAILIPCVIASVFFSPEWIFQVILAAIGLLAYHEFDQIVAASGIRRSGWPGMVCGLALLFLSPAAAIPVLITMVGMSLAMTADNLRTSMAFAGAFTLGVFYIFGAWRCAGLLHSINPHWLLFALLLGWGGDTAAYYVGKSIGKRKLAPQVSPAKTWEGTAGSVFGSVLAGGFYAHIFIPGAPLWMILVLAVIGNVAGQVGDLAESALKRGANVKDSGTLLPGHGGVLDRIDSSLFAIPIIYLLLTYWG